MSDQAQIDPANDPGNNPDGAPVTDSAAGYSRLFRYSRVFAFVFLAAITLYGIYQMITSDLSEVLSFWTIHGKIIPLLILISVIDVILECLAWMWVYHRFDVKVFDRIGALAFLAGRAGLLLPAQLGRLIRPDAMRRQNRLSLPHGLKAEAVMFAMDSISVLSLLAGLIVYQVYSLAAPIVVIAIILVSMLLGNHVAKFLTHTPLHLPIAFWWKSSTFIIIMICLLGWVAHGVALYVVVAELPGEMTLWDSLFYGPGSAVLGVATGLPGGIGATEGFLGASMSLRSIPVEYLALAVLAFRLITFWMWIPIGWAAIAILRRMNTAETKLAETTV